MEAVYFGGGIGLALLPDKYRLKLGKWTLQAGMLLGVCVAFRIWEVYGLEWRWESLRWVMIPCEIVVVLSTCLKLVRSGLVRKDGVVGSLVGFSFPIYVAHYFSCYFFVRSGPHRLVETVVITSLALLMICLGATLVKRYVPGVYAVVTGNR